MDVYVPDYVYPFPLFICFVGVIVWENFKEEYFVDQLYQNLIQVCWSLNIYEVEELWLYHYLLFCVRVFMVLTYEMYMHSKRLESWVVWFQSTLKIYPEGQKYIWYGCFYISV